MDRYEEDKAELGPDSAWALWAENEDEGFGLGRWLDWHNLPRDWHNLPRGKRLASLYGFGEVSR